MTGRPGKPSRPNRHDWLGVLLGLPVMVWLSVFLVVPGYVLLAVAFGTVDPIFRAPLPAWNPLDWQFDTFRFVLTHLWDPSGGGDGFLGPPVLRTLGYVTAAVALCLLIAFPVAFFVAQRAGRWRRPVLAALLAPFWISYLMRMLAWVNLLQVDGPVNRLLSLGGLFSVQVDWLNGRPLTVILGLTYGYVPYLILPLYAALDRISPSLLEAAQDLGAGPVEVFTRVVLPLSGPGIAAGLVLITLPMTGDYFTTDLLSGSPRTSMVGNLINESIGTPGQAGQAAALVVLLALVLLLPMVLYLRRALAGQDLRS